MKPEHCEHNLSLLGICICEPVNSPKWTERTGHKSFPVLNESLSSPFIAFIGYIMICSRMISWKKKKTERQHWLGNVAGIIHEEDWVNIINNCFIIADCCSGRYRLGWLSQHVL